MKEMLYETGAQLIHSPPDMTASKKYSSRGGGGGGGGRGGESNRLNCRQKDNKRAIKKRGFTTRRGDARSYRECWIRPVCVCVCVCVCEQVPIDRLLGGHERLEGCSTSPPTLPSPLNALSIPRAPEMSSGRRESRDLRMDFLRFNVKNEP